MAATWHSHLSGKLALAQSLLRVAEADDCQPLLLQACKQGAIELMLRSRQLLLQTLAHCYQQRNAQPQTVAQLAQLIGEQALEVDQLAQLQSAPYSWWCHLQQLDDWQSHPPAARKTISDDNIIAVAPAAGADYSLTAIQASLTAFIQFAADVKARHSEW